MERSIFNFYRFIKYLLFVLLLINVGFVYSQDFKVPLTPQVGEESNHAIMITDAIENTYDYKV